MSRLSHPAELLLHQYLNDAANDKTSISKDTIKQICDDIADAMQKQFGESRSREFR